MDWDELSFAADCAMSSQQVCSSEDLQVALLIMYELHYRGSTGSPTGGNGIRVCWVSVR